MLITSYSGYSKDQKGKCHRTLDLAEANQHQVQSHRFTLAQVDSSKQELFRQGQAKPVLSTYDHIIDNVKKSLHGRRRHKHLWQTARPTFKVFIMVSVLLSRNITGQLIVVSYSMLQTFHRYEMAISRSSSASHYIRRRRNLLVDPSM